MIGSILLDTGPLVAGLDSSDQYHNKALSHFRKVNPPLLTCEAVLSESCFLLRHNKSALAWLSKWLKEGKIHLAFSLSDNSKQVFKLMNKYNDLPMSLADACLVSMAEDFKDKQLFTFDYHFEIYRTPSRRIIQTIGLEK